MNTLGHVCFYLVNLAHIPSPVHLAHKSHLYQFLPPHTLRFILFTQENGLAKANSIALGPYRRIWGRDLPVTRRWLPVPQLRTLRAPTTTCPWVLATHDNLAIPLRKISFTTQFGALST